MSSQTTIGHAALLLSVASAVVSVTTMVGVALFGIGSGPEHWPFFAVHLLAAFVGLAAAIVALFKRKWWAAVPFVISAYVVLFQAGWLPPPRFLL